MLLQHTNIMGVVVAMVAAFSSSPWQYVSAQPQENASQILLRFKTALAHADPALSNWNPSTPPCNGNTGNWAGVLCYNGYVWGLQLENMGLQGQIDVDSLVGLPYLRTLSFANNSFQGTMPDWRKLGSLKSLYLNGNQFSGQIANDAFAGMPSLNKVYLSNNKFSGPIPDSLTSPNLVEVGLDNNLFSGAIPAVNSQNLKVFNVSNNQLQGPVPPSLLGMDPSSFSGNKALCGSPGGVSCNPPKPPPDMEPVLHPLPGGPPVDAAVLKNNSRKPSPAKIAIIILSILLGLFVLLLLLLLCCRTLLGDDDGDDDSESARKEYISEMASTYGNKSHLPMTAALAASPRAGEIGGKGIRSPLRMTALAASPRAGEIDGKDSGSPLRMTAALAASPRTGEIGGKDSRSSLRMTAALAASPRAGEIGGKGSETPQASQLSFVKDDRQKFDLQDLMRASAEVLGCGNFGASYKAVLVDGEALVVKRYKQMNAIAKDEFHEHMKRLGMLKHPNLLPLVAYLYRNKEKLLVFDFMSNNSLAKHLHDDGKRPEDWPKPLNWPCRLKIIKGVAKGLAYLYAELPNLNAPHGHLKSSNVLIDANYNARLMDYTLGPVVNPAQITQALVAYKCPEYAQTCRISKKSDVWCLGILILETLTAKPVADYLSQGSEPYSADLARWINGIVEEASTKGAQVFDKEMEMSLPHSRLEMEKLLLIGITCSREDLDRRLDLEEAVRRIELVQE